MTVSILSYIPIVCTLYVFVFLFQFVFVRVILECCAKVLCKFSKSKFRWSSKAVRWENIQISEIINFHNGNKDIEYRLTSAH